MRLLLDTHLVVWTIDDPGKLTSVERDLIAADDSDLLISAISLWEIRMKGGALARRGHEARIPSPAKVITFFEGIGATMAPILPATLTIVLEPPTPHADPFDEMLLVHAGELDARLLTRDRKLKTHPLAYQA